MRILSKFIVWRVALVFVVFLAGKFLVTQNDFLGGGRELYMGNPYFWSAMNFDGEHYLAIARDGYKPLTYFYFPLYPLMVRYVSNLLGQSLFGYALSGLVLSNGLFLGALMGLKKLLRMDYKTKMVELVLLLTLVFPTSFYFGAFYTESLFLFLVVWSFWAARQKRWFLAGVLGSLATASRVVGIVLLPALLVEWWLQNKKEVKINTDLAWVMLVPAGLFVYMYYLQQVTGDSLEFLHSVEIFGDQRSSKLIMLPQVFYRYIFKILPSLTYYWPAVFVTWLEFLVGSVFLLLSIYGFGKLRHSYWMFMVGGYLVPTLSGSFSSLPRYVLPLFPAFVLVALYVQNRRMLRNILVVLLAIGLVIATAMFTKGYWVA